MCFEGLLRRHVHATDVALVLPHGLHPAEVLAAGHVALHHVAARHVRVAHRAVEVVLLEPKAREISVPMHRR